MQTAFRMAVDAELRASRLAGEERRRTFEWALAAYDDILRVAPRHAAALNNRANVQRELARLPGALRDITYALHFGAHVDRGFHLRHAGDLLRENGEVYASTQRYWAALETDPYELTAHARIRERLRTSEPLQVANYLRFLVETRQIERIVDAAAVLPLSREIAAIVATGMSRAAATVPVADLETLAEPMLAREEAMTREMHAVLRTERQSFAWIASDANASAAYRHLSHEIGDNAAVRGDLERAERAHLLAMQMPGADETDRARWLEFVSEYKSLPDLRHAVAQEEQPSSPPSFHTLAVALYQPFGEPACGDAEWGIRHHLLRLIAARAPLPPTTVSCPIAFAETGCHRDCNYAVQLGTTDGDPGKAILTIPPNAEACALERAVALITADYRPSLPPLVIETAPRHRVAADELRNSLLCGGIDPAAVRIAETARAGRRIRVRFDAR